MQSKRELKIKPAITIHDIALAPRKREKGKKKINERHSFRDSPLFLLLIHTCPNNRVFIFPQCIPRVTKLLRRWTIGHEGRRPYQGGSEVTTGNRSRIRFKDPREIVCPPLPPSPYSPSFLSLLNFKTSLGVSRTHTHAARAPSFCLYYITRDTRATFLHDPFIDRDQTLENFCCPLFIDLPGGGGGGGRGVGKREVVETRLFPHRQQTKSRFFER